MLKWFIIASVFFVSCAVSKDLGHVNMESKYVNFSKVKVKFNSNSFGNIKLKGYIFLIKDSLLFFKFYGPLSVEALSGGYMDNFLVNDLYHNTKYSNAVEEVYRQTGIKFDRQVLENFLKGNLILAKVRLLQINDGYLRFDFDDNKRKPFLSLGGENSNGRLGVSVSKARNLLPSKITLQYNKDIINWSLSIEFVEITNERRKLKFE